VTHKLLKMQNNKLSTQHTNNLFSTIQIIFNHETFQTLSIRGSLDLLAIRDEHLYHATRILYAHDLQKRVTFH